MSDVRDVNPGVFAGCGGSGRDGYISMLRSARAVLVGLACLQHTDE